MADIPKDSVNISSYEAFFNQMNGNGVDVDGYYGYQCWDGCAVLWYKLGWTLYTGSQGYAYECWSVSRDANTHTPTITQITNLSDVKRGDIVVFAPNIGWTGDAGHIGYANEDYNGSGYLSTFGQNQGSGSGILGKPFSVQNIQVSGGAFLGAFRYDAWQQPVPPTPTTKKRKKFPWVVAWNNWGYN